MVRMVRMVRWTFLSVLLLSSLLVGQMLGAVPQLSTLYGFTGGNDGAMPTVQLVSDASGALYGTTPGGGTLGLGNVFQVTPPTVAGGAWGFNVLYSFGSGSDGQGPQSSLILDAKGNLYGTTYLGGTAGLGTVFKLAPPTVSGGAWTETVLYSFAGGTDGAYPFGGLVLDRKGVLYGTTQQGGTRVCTDRKTPCGTIFQLKPGAGGKWTESVLYNFTGLSGGAFPDASLTIDAAGNLYGTTQYGGSTNPRYGGSVFQLKPPPAGSTTWTFVTLYDFLSSGQPGYYAKLAFDTAGALYGVSWSGGTSGSGYVFKLAPPVPPATIWTLSTLWNFSGGSDGAIPFGGLVVSGTTLYGTTYSGGNLGLCNGIGCGVVYRLTPVTGGWKESLLYTFLDGTDGATPQAGLLFKGGVLYGTTSAGYASAPGGGTVFRIK